MVTWRPAVFAQLAAHAAVEETAVAESKLLTELERLGFAADGPPGSSVEFRLGQRAIRLTAPLDLEPDSLEFVHGLLSSLSRRADAERRAEQAEERASMLSAASFEGILVHKNGNVIAVNDSLAELFGIPKDELLGPGTIARCVAPDDVPTVLEKMRSGYEGSYLIEGVRGDKSRFRAELHSKQGKLGEEPIRVAAVRDVTERERMLSLLRDSEAQLRDLVDAVFDVTMLSRDGQAIDVSEAQSRVTGYAREDIIGRKVWDFVAPEARSKTEEFVSNNRTGAYESILVAKNGERIPVEVVATNTTLGGKPVRLAGLRDLRVAKEQERQREHLRKQMEQAQRLDSLGALAGGVAHDFNNLLVGILGTAELLKEDLQDPELIDLAETIFETSVKAKELTGRLLAYSGKTTLVKVEPVDLKSLFEQLDRLTRFTRPRQIALTIDIEGPCVVEGEEASITQVMLNLVTNAIDAMEDAPGSIFVRGRSVNQPDARWDDALGAEVSPGNYVQIEVSDTGIGMDPETALRAFEPFFTTKAQGHGLGLAASLGIVKAHGGAVHVKSERGRGSTFAVLLPSAGELPRETRAAAIPVKRSRLILVVDDEAVVSRHVVRVLKRRGYEVLTADGPSQCLAHVEKRTPDLILMDMTMPEGSGAETATILRSRGLDVPIVLTSGYVPNASRDDFAPELFQGFLQKPYSISELASAIEDALQG